MLRWLPFMAFLAAALWSLDEWGLGASAVFTVLSTLSAGWASDPARDRARAARAARALQPLAPPARTRGLAGEGGGRAHPHWDQD